MLNTRANRHNGRILHNVSVVQDKKWNRICANSCFFHPVWLYWSTLDISAKFKWRGGRYAEVRGSSDEHEVEEPPGERPEAPPGRQYQELEPLLVLVLGP